MSQPIRYDSTNPVITWDGPHLWDGLINSPVIMTETKVSYAVEDVLGFCQSSKAMINTYKTAMIAAGVDPTAALAQLETSKDDLNAQNAVQENLKTQLRNQTPLVEAARNVAYGKASNACDLLISAFGRTSEQAKEATNLRKSLRPQKNPPTPTPPNP